MQKKKVLFQNNQKKSKEIKSNLTKMIKKIRKVNKIKKKNSLKQKPKISQISKLKRQ